MVIDLYRLVVALDVAQNLALGQIEAQPLIRDTSLYCTKMGASGINIAKTRLQQCAADLGIEIIFATFNQAVPMDGAFIVFPHLLNPTKVVTGLVHPHALAIKPQEILLRLFRLLQAQRHQRRCKGGVIVVRLRLEYLFELNLRLRRVIKIH